MATLAGRALNGGSPSTCPGVDKTRGSQPQPYPVALLHLQGMALRFILLGDPALVPLQSGSHLHLLEDITTFLLARWERLPWWGQGHIASEGEPRPGTVGFLSSPPNMPLSLLPRQRL